MRTIYQRFGPIKRTVLLRKPWWLTDIQALPPRNWCVCCGAEVYGRGQERCRRCAGQ